ncbi:hypothetical protein [Enterococcus sp. 2201sp1_2201st1_B8_2201SCRN_220225]
MTVSIADYKKTRQIIPKGTIHRVTILIRSFYYALVYLTMAKPPA